MRREELIKKRFFLSTLIEAMKMAIRKIDYQLNPNIERQRRQQMTDNDKENQK